MEAEKRENSLETNPDDSLVGLLVDVHRASLLCYPLIMVFFTGRSMPAECIPMHREPRPAVGFQIGLNFNDHLSKAFALNSSIHDGALVFGRIDDTESYTLREWSMRIVSSHVAKEAEANRGSAYHSALALSSSNDVDLVCLFTPEKLEIFRDGEKTLHAKSIVD